MVKSLVSRFQRTEARFENYLIRPIERDDLDIIAEWPLFSDSQFAWANFPATTDQLRDSWYKRHTGEFLVWFVIINEKLSQGVNNIIARSSITQPISGTDCLFGIVLRPDVVNQGIGTLCTRLQLLYIFEITSLQSIWLESKYDNKRARRVWEKVGFDFLGHHYRRGNFGRYDLFSGYRISRETVASWEETISVKR